MDPQLNRQCNKLILQEKHSAVLGHFWAWRRIPVTMAETRRKMVKLEVVLVTKFIVEAILNFQRILKLHQHLILQPRKAGLDMTLMIGAILGFKYILKLTT